MKNKAYGYARISTQKQSIERQVRNISEAYPSATIITEAYTGTSIERPAFTKLLKVLKAGDTVVFDSVSRMSRNASEGWELYEDLYEQGINLVFLKEPHINTETYSKSLQNSIPSVGGTVEILLDGVRAFLKELAKEQIKLAFEQSEKEVTDLHKRTSEGLMTAKLNGKQVGQAEGAHWETKKAKEAKALILKHSKDFNGTLSDAECMKLCGIARNTFYAYKKALKG